MTEAEWLACTDPEPMLGAELTAQAPDGLLHPPRRHFRRPSDSFVVLGRAD